MYNGQFEIRNFPVAGEPSSDGVAGALAVPDLLSELQAARKDPPRATAAAAAAPPPMKRRREVRLGLLRGMALCLSWISDEN
jgi:hypothetical protein